MAFYYFDGENQKGPFSIEELKLENINSDTLVWTQGMNEQKKIRNVLDLKTILNFKETPPPLPREILLKKTTTAKSKNGITIFLVAWIGFHLFALFLAQSEVKIFNNDVYAGIDGFWPFVQFTNDHLKRYRPEFPEKSFTGFFVDYDKTEFFVYVGGVILICILIGASNIKKELI